MKRLKKIVIMAVVSISLMASSIAFAQGWGGGGRRWNNNPNQTQPRFNRPGPIMAEEMYNARVEVLSELTGQSQETIKGKLEYKPVWSVLDEYKVDYTTFRSKMTEKRNTVIQKAVEDGRITQEQADFMKQNSNQGQRYGRSGYGRGRGFGQGFGGNCLWN